MAGRVAVTPATVREYLDRLMTGENYHLMYGLHLLSRDRFVAVMDALLNGELQPEELLRLGGFTDAEADFLLRETLGSWVSPAVAEHRTGEDGYAYLADGLGLGELVRSQALAPARTPAGRLLGARVAIGRGGHSGTSEVDAIFDGRILPGALAGLPQELYLPQGEAAVRAIPTARADAARADLVWSLARVMLSPLMGDGGALRALVTVGGEPSAMTTAPALAEWVMAESRPAADVRLQMHREAAERTVAGEYTRDEISAKLDEIWAAVPSFVGTGRAMSRIDFQAAIVAAAVPAHFAGDAELVERSSIATDAIQAIFDHRDRLRGFALRVLEGCERNLLGDYPPS